MPEPILLRHTRAPGDITCLTALPRDLHMQHPGRFKIYVNTSCASLWRENPHVEILKKPDKNVRNVALTYGHLINQANRVRLHFVTAFHRNFRERTGVEVDVQLPRGDLHLSQWQKENPPFDRRYWFILSGGKRDFTTKVWSAMRHQQVVNQLRGHGVDFVQDGALHSGHWHPPLENVTRTTGKTNLRDMMWLIYHADGVICPITSAMHIAAAFEKPCVCVAGGREHWWWEAYVNVEDNHFGPVASRKVRVPHRYLHTQGLLDCCSDRGCWKNKVTKVEQDNKKSYCKMPENDGYGQIIPACLKMITVGHVVEAVLSYYEDGTLPPVGTRWTGLDHELRLNQETPVHA